MRIKDRDYPDGSKVYVHRGHTHRPPDRQTWYVKSPTGIWCTIIGAPPRHTISDNAEAIEECLREGLLLPVVLEIDVTQASPEDVLTLIDQLGRRRT